MPQPTFFYALRRLPTAAYFSARAQTHEVGNCARLVARHHVYALLHFCRLGGQDIRATNLASSHTQQSQGHKIIVIKTEFEKTAPYFQLLLAGRNLGCLAHIAISGGLPPSNSAPAVGYTNSTASDLLRLAAWH